MQRMARSAIVAAATVALASPVSAHPGHGLDGGSYALLHYLREPLHLLGGLVAAFTVAGGLRLARAWRRQRARR